MKNWMIGLGCLAGFSALGCGGKFDVERDFVTSIDNKAAVVSQLQVEQVPGSEEVIDPKMTLCLEFTDFMVDQLVDVMEDTLTQVDACFQIDGSNRPPIRELVQSGEFQAEKEAQCESSVPLVYTTCNATIGELETCGGEFAQLANHYMMKGLSYGCDNVTVPPVAPLSSVCQAVMQKCPGLFEVTDEGDSSWESPEAYGGWESESGDSVGSNNGGVDTDNSDFWVFNGNGGGDDSSGSVDTDWQNEAGADNGDDSDDWGNAGDSDDGFDEDEEDDESDWY